MGFFFETKKKKLFFLSKLFLVFLIKEKAVYFFHKIFDFFWIIFKMALNILINITN